MLRHIGKRRGFKHNLRLAILLCTVAGFINAAGFIAFGVLTTNVTGHAALLVVNLTIGKFRAVRMVALWLLLFLSGAFASSLYIGKVGRDKPLAYTAPIMTIVILLILVATIGRNYDHTLRETEYLAGSLLFAMGMQNALVSIVSGTEVRTTHLTGIFTDLGIDLSGALIRRKQFTAADKRRILLRIAIIFFFLFGGLAGGFAFPRLYFAAFLIPAGLLIFVLVYDYFHISVTQIKRQMHR